MPNRVEYVNRADLGAFLRRITVNPKYIFSVVCRRRGDLLMKYPPVNDLARGKDCHVGDHSDLTTRQFVCGGRKRIVLQRKGTERSMVVKNKTDNQPMKHWQPRGGALKYRPADRGLFLVAGMYNDDAADYGTGKRIGRHGEWRPWAHICLRTTSLVRYDHVDYHVVDPEPVAV